MANARSALIDAATHLASLISSARAQELLELHEELQCLADTLVLAKQHYHTHVCNGNRPLLAHVMDNLTQAHQCN